uniref:Apolipoprotein C-IV n=1 Tax=Monopterus albus TaxID=43700 RepID=A0A3Q3QSX5_MONAL
MSAGNSQNSQQYFSSFANTLILFNAGLLFVAQKVSETAKYVGATALGFFSAYYEDHIQPVTDGYAKWASDVKTSTQNKIQTIIDNYMPFIAK